MRVVRPLLRIGESYVASRPVDLVFARRANDLYPAIWQQSNRPGICANPLNRVIRGLCFRRNRFGSADGPRMT